MRISDRTSIDPENRYPSDGPREVEKHAFRILESLPDSRVERTRDSIQIETGGEAGIVILVTAEAIELRLPTIEWTKGAYGPAASSRLWRRVRTRDASDEKLEGLIQGALAARERQFRKCRFCGSRFPPERRHGSVCHGCAELHMGIVH
jgi:hypothetical protein